MDRSSRPAMTIASATKGAVRRLDLLICLNLFLLAVLLHAAVSAGQ